MADIRLLLQKKIQDGDESIADLVFDAINDLGLARKIAKNISRTIEDRDNVLYDKVRFFDQDVDMNGFEFCSIISELPFEEIHHQYCSCCNDDGLNKYTIEKRYKVRNFAGQEFVVDLVYWFTGTPGCCGSKCYKVKETE